MDKVNLCAGLETVEKKKIPDELGRDFGKVETRRKIMEQYGDCKSIFCGNNEDGEMVEIHVSADGIILKTFQLNGWVRVNDYDVNGYDCGETFEGKWK